MKHLKILIAVLLLSLLSAQGIARELRNISLEDETDLEIRIYPADGDSLLLGFACDEGNGLNEEATASLLAQDGIEIWMPNMLGAYMLPKVKSSLAEIPTEALISLINKAQKTGKKVYLIAGGSDSELILRSAAEWEKTHATGSGNNLQGAILMFPRLIDGKPIPGEAPNYVAAVGQTHLPLMVLEGERTPNRWGVKHLTSALEAGGSDVSAKLIPSVRGYFFKRDDANVPEELVTSQLSGLIKASMFILNGTHHEIN